MIAEALRYTLAGAKYTVIITAAAFVLGAAGALPVTLLRRSRSRALRITVRLMVDLVRSVPPITWLFIIFFGLPGAGLTLNAVTSGIVGLSVIATAYLSEIYRAGLASVAAGQWEAGRALGLRNATILVRIVAPQTARVVVPTAATYLIGLLKDSAVTSTIGVAEIARQTTDEVQRTGHGLTVFVTAGLVYLLLSLPMALAARGVDRRLAVDVSMQ